MTLSKLITHLGEWLKGEGPDADIVISSRVRLARNLSDFVFITLATDQQRAEIENYIKEKLTAITLPPGMLYLNFSEFTETDLLFLVERHLISREHAVKNGYRAAAIAVDESWSIMINEEDHLRIQVMRSGLQLAEAWKAIDYLDSQIEKHLRYAFSPDFGYLTACPTNVGTGLRISVMMHLPALVIANQLDKVLHALSRIKYTVRGFYGEGSRALSDLYQISNQVALGKSEDDIVREMQNIIPEIIRYERTWREKLLSDPSKKLEDRIMRAYGILKTACSISSEETMELLSALRLGVNLKVIKDVPINTVNQLFILSQPAHLQKTQKRSLNSQERDIIRAKLIKQYLA